MRIYKMNKFLLCNNLNNKEMNNVITFTTSKMNI